MHVMKLILLERIQENFELIFNTWISHPFNKRFKFHSISLNFLLWRGIFFDGAIKTKYRNRLEIDNDMRYFLSCIQPRLERLITKKAASTFPLLNAFVIKKKTHLSVCLEKSFLVLKAIIVAVFLKRVIDYFTGNNIRKSNNHCSIAFEQIKIT